MSERRISLPTGTLWIRVEEGAFDLDTLCCFAARANPQRGFLVVSKVLGKHWPARPAQMQRVQRELAQRLALGPGPWLFVALAETATGLGQGVFESILARHPQADALFIHTTRYRLSDRPALAFQETHCHAPEQWLYEPFVPVYRQRFREARELILIDDELTTGNTLCNLVEAYRQLNPGLERVHVVGITQFGGPDLEARLTARLGLSVHCSAVLSGSLHFQPAAGWTLAEPPPPAVGDPHCASGELAEELGRFGIDQALTVPAATLDPLIEGLGPDDPVLVLGTGEFMHLAFRVGLGLEERGLDVSVQATSRSPILMGGAIKQRLIFADNYGEGILNYLYNVNPNKYARIIICHETPSAGLADLLRNLGSHHRLCRLPQRLDCPEE